ncbi:MAG: Rne/Rng family ribonuclease [Candidatus Omnitrophota bacterium]
MDKVSKRIVINVGICEDRVAVLENGKLEEFYVERSDSETLFGNVYKGVVESVIPGIGAAFVNIGTGKNGFLYVDDIHQTPMTPDDRDDFVMDNDKPRGKGKRYSEITNLVKQQQELLVQVTKEPMGTKGPRITTHLSIPGRFLVLTPFDGGIGISKRISEIAERNRIRDIVREFHLPDGIGLIVRTAAKGMSDNDLRREIRYLTRLWSRISHSGRRVKAPVVLYEEYGLIMRIIRDEFTEAVDEVVVDSKGAYKNIVRFLNIFLPSLKKKLKFHNERVPIFEKYGIEKEIEKIFHKKIHLKSGGSIVIEQTEGMVAIDVNTEKFIGRRDAEDTVFRTNMEAAREIARQIRLRDIGGILIIDFIDMRVRDHRLRVQQALEQALRRDKARFKILSISQFGVVEMTRQRMRRSLESTMYRECPYCHGRGLVKKETTVALQIMRKIEADSHDNKARHLDVWVHPEVYDYIMANEKELLLPLRRKCRKEIKLYKDATLHAEDIRII